MKLPCLIEGVATVLVLLGVVDIVGAAGVVRVVKW